MAGFNLFNTTAPTSSTQSAPFGASTTANASNLFLGSNTSGFGNQTQNQTFGGSPSGGNISFGLPKTQNTLSFGTPTATVTGGLTTGQPNLTFGTPTAQSNVSFGTPTAQPNVSFGAATSQSTLGFGTPTAQTTFGTSAPQATTFGSPGALPTFGSLKPQTPTGGTSLFGSVVASTPQGTNLLGSSTLTTNTNVVKPTFAASGFSATSTAPGLSFGLQPSTAATIISQTTAATAQPNLYTLPTISAAATTGQLSFGLGGATQSVSFGSGTSVTSTAVQPTTAQAGLGGLTFGASATTAPSLSFGGLGTTSAPASTAPTTGLLGSSFGAAATSASGIFSWQKPTIEATPTNVSIGLGGVDHTAISTAQSTTNTIVSAKEQMLPNEIQQTVASFKEYVKTQKNLSSEVARTSGEPLTKLTQQIGALNNLILTLGSILSQQKFTAEKIKLETIKSLNDYELAQKIKDSPVASEERMYAIRKYFIEKISAFEESTKTLQEKIEYVYQHVITLPQENSLSAEALKLIVKKLHDSFVVIGARAYKLHNDMQLLKVQYLTLRNQYVKDNSSISFSLNRELQLPFSDIRSKSNAAEFSLEGPNPFSRTASGSFNSLLLTSQNRNFLQTTTPSKDWNSSFNTTKPFGFSDVSSNVGFDQNSSLNLSGSQQFNLQKPPIGSKRGKR